MDSKVYHSGFPTLVTRQNFQFYVKPRKYTKGFRFFVLQLIVQEASVNILTTLEKLEEKLACSLDVVFNFWCVMYVFILRR